MASLPCHIVCRPATEEDLASLVTVDDHSATDHGRREYLRRAVATDSCSIAVVGTTVVGYGILNYSFFDLGFVALLYIHRDHRKQGIGGALMAHMEALCRTPKLFTSTNLSNLPMQGLLAKHGYELSGVVHHLDEGDPELFFFKRIVVTHAEN